MEEGVKGETYDIHEPFSKKKRKIHSLERWGMFNEMEDGTDGEIVP